MSKWKCNVCSNEIDKSNKARHLKSSKHLSNLNNFKIKNNNKTIFQLNETLFESTNKQKKFKCKICHIKVYDLKKHLKVSAIKNG